MSSRKSSRKNYDPPDPAWLRLCAAFPSFTSEKETIYALPPELVERIQAEAKHFFTTEQLAFENALSAGGRTGFFRGSSFVYPYLNQPLVPDTECDQISEELNRLAQEQMEGQGASRGDMEDFFVADQKQKEEIAARQRGYLGWLVTDPGFQLMKKQFRKKWAARASQQSDLPQLPVSFLGEKAPIPSNADKPFVIASWQFCQTWSLRRMTTWELPIPIGANIAGASLHPVEALGNSGCTLFIPWYLARDQKLTLRDILATQSMHVSLNHLQPWFQKGPKNLGHFRYGQLLQLYVYYELALKERYSNQLRGNTTPIDRAFGQFLRTLSLNGDAAVSADDSTKKLREALNRRLRECNRV